MSARDWQPGDVITIGSGVRGFVTEHGGLPWVYWPDGSNSAPARVDHARRLAVIDPEDREQVERLAKCWREVHGEAELTDEPWSVPGLRMQAALREYANPTPPKPDEPLGLGAVVEEVDGQRWMRGSSMRGLKAWVNDEALDSEWRAYADIDAVRVLAEGVQP